MADLALCVLTLIALVYALSAIVAGGNALWRRWRP